MLMIYEDQGLWIESFAIIINTLHVYINKLKLILFKAMSHGAIFLATCNAILLLRDVNLANTRLHYILLMYSSHIKQSSLINIS